VTRFELSSIVVTSDIVFDKEASRNLKKKRRYEDHFRSIHCYGKTKKPEKKQDKIEHQMEAKSNEVTRI